MDLALGTVQFGVDYGIAGARRPDDETAAKILTYAWDAGIRRLDTAPGYGDIESRLLGLCGNREFSIVSKIPKVPATINGEALLAWLTETVETSRRRLGDRLRGLIFHEPQMTLGDHGVIVRETLARLLDGTGISIGASHYDDTTLLEMATWPDCKMAQVPGNALDQRIVKQREKLEGMEVSLRSAFLQGLLLMDPQAAAERLPAAASAVHNWRHWCARRGLSPLEAALSVVKGFSMVDYCLVGVDSLAQLSAIRNAWERSTAVTAPELQSHDPAVIDPRLWSLS